MRSSATSQEGKVSSTHLAALPRHRRSAHPELHRGPVPGPPWPSQPSGPGYQRPL